MIMDTRSPVVRNRDGAVIGIDWRRIGGMIPGRMEARHLCPGDRFDAAGVTVTVESLPTGSVLPGMVHIQATTDGGAPISVERGLRETVFVKSAGAFDRE